LAETEYVTVPLPLPLLPDVIVIQRTLFEALHLQPDGEATLKLPVPPVNINDLLDGEME